MSTERNDGGPSFPTPWAGGSATEGGMSLRDWFAGQVLGEAFRMVMDLPGGEGRPHPAKWAAAAAYEIADAMLAEREKGK